VRVVGDSMIGAGIFPGDIAVVDRSKTARDKSIVLAILDGEFTLKRYRQYGTRHWLEAENANYKPIELTEDSAFEIWGVIKRSIRML
jgi:DNA polymerase V